MTAMLKFVTEKDHIYALNADGEMMAKVKFPEISPGIYDICSTDVDPSLRGQGIAGKLVQAAVNEIHRKGGNVQATCSYAAAWLKRHQK